jgi:hypothetical protein
MFRKFSSGFSRAIDRLLRSLPGILHTTGTAADPDAATTWRSSTRRSTI